MDTIFLDEFSREVWETTYKHTTDNTIDDTLKRVATAIASVEKTPSLREEWTSKFYEILNQFSVTAGGRILANAGTDWNGTTLMNCFQGGTTVMTSEGPVPIRDLSGFTTKVLNKDKKWVEAKFSSYGKQDLYKISLENGEEIEATANHRWLVKTPNKGVLKEKTTLELVGNQIPYIVPSYNLVLNKEEFKTGVQHGLVYGDGNLYLDGKKSILHQFGDSCHLVEDFFSDFTEAEYQKKEIRKVTVNYLPAKFKTKVPCLEAGYSVDYIKGFIAGLVAADGYVDKYGSVMILQSNEDLLVEVKRIAAQCGIAVTSISLYREMSLFNGEYAPCYKLSFLKSSFHSELILKNTHKEYFNKKPSKLELSVRVLAVKKTNRSELVYCCEESKTHTFVLGNFLLTGNCFVGPKPKYDQDSIEGILSVLLSQTLTLKSEGGWGMNFSFIRPRGSFIHSIGVESPGAVKYQELFNTSSDVITSGSGKKKKSRTDGKTKIRKGAMMSVLDVWHPDVEEHITAKLQEGRLNKFNLSVNCSNEFMDRVAEIAAIKTKQETCEDTERESLNSRLKTLEKWDLIFPNTKDFRYKKEWDGNMAAWKAKGYEICVHKTVNVSDLWELIMQSTYSRNDPGVLFLDRANETHCYYYGKDAHIAATNPCGEQCLPFGFVCNLGSINLTQFVQESKCGKFASFDWVKFKKFIPMVVRMLDNVNDLSTAPLPEYTESIKNVRRIGVGVMGWGSLLYMLKIRFASGEAEEFKHNIMNLLTNTGINASIDLAVEKGMFFGCEPKKHADAKYFKQINLDKETLERIRIHGIRNSALFSCQPTGNTGVLANVVSGGIEPLFLAEYVRTAIVDGCPQDMIGFTPKYWEGEFKETEVFKWVSEGSDKILRGEHNGTVYKIDKNRGLTKEITCIDYGVRWLKERNQYDPTAYWAVTSSSLSVDEHLSDMKGFSKWIDSSISKTVNIANEYPYKDFKNLYLNAYLSGVLKGITTYRAGTMMNVLAEKKKEESAVGALHHAASPKRPKELKGEIFALNYKKEKLYVAIGLWSDNSPFEVFTGINFRHQIEHAKGKIIKLARSKYDFVTEEGEVYKLTNGHSDSSADALTRCLSVALRHGVDMSYLVHQLEKTEGDLTSFSKVISRVLKKFIKNGTAVSGEECPECHGKLIRKEGCIQCSDCSFSKCG